MTTTRINLITEIKENQSEALDKEFFAAITARNIKKTNAMLKSHPELIHAKAYYKESCEKKTSFKPIHLAARMGNMELFQLLSKAPGVCLDEPESDLFHHHTPLMIAIEHQHYAIALQLINDSKVDLTKTDKYGDTVLHKAITYRRKWDPELKRDINNYTIIKALLQSNKVNINQPCNAGYTPLHSLISDSFYEEDNELLNLLLSHRKIDVNITNNELDTPLHTALSHHEGIGAIRLLLQHPAIKVNAVNQHGFSPLHIIAKRTGLACLNNSKLSHDYIDYAVGPIKYWSEHYALYGYRRYYNSNDFYSYNKEAMAEEAVKLLIEQGADVCQSTAIGCLAPFFLKRADQFNLPPSLFTTNIKILEMLINKGAHVNNTLSNLIGVNRTLFNIKDKITDSIYLAELIKLSIKNELSRISQAMDKLQTLSPDPFKDKGSLGQLRAILFFTYMDEIEEALPIPDRILRYKEILDLNNDLSKQPEESKTLRDFILGQGKPLNDQKYIEYAYNEPVTNQFDLIRHTLIKQQTFSADQKDRYIPAENVMLGVRSILINRVKELEIEHKKECAARKIHGYLRIHRFLKSAQKIVSEQKNVKAFIEQYDTAVTQLGINDSGSKQRIDFIRENLKNYKSAFEKEQILNAAIMGSIKFFKNGDSNALLKAKKLLDYARKIAPS